MATNVKNPTAVEFTSDDHAKLTGYEIDIVSSAGAVVQTIPTGKGTQDPTGLVTVPFAVQPLAFGSYTVRVRSVASALKSVDSAPSPSWDRVPAQPVKVTIR